MPEYENVDFSVDMAILEKQFTNIPDKSMGSISFEITIGLFAPMSVSEYKYELKKISVDNDTELVITERWVFFYTKIHIKMTAVKSDLLTAARAVALVHEEMKRRMKQRSG